MKFLSADVKKPLASVSAMVEEGNRVVFSPKENFVECLATGENTNLGKRNGVFILAVETDRGGKRGAQAMDIGEVEGERRTEDGDDLKFMRRMDEMDMAVFRRQAA